MIYSRHFKRTCVAGLAMLNVMFSGAAHPQAIPTQPFVRVAQLRINAAQLARFRAAAQKLGHITMQEEPGCLALYAVVDATDSSQVTVFEMYRDEAAYEEHLHSPHFADFRRETSDVVNARHLSTAIPLSLADKTFSARDK